MIRAAIDTKALYTPAQKTDMTPQDQTKPFVFGTVSCFKPAKNIPDLIRAFAAVYEKNPNTRLEIIGDGILRPEIEQLITTYNISHAVILHGWQHDICPYLTLWHAFCLTSLWEGLPCAVVEARAQKLPVLCYNTGGISDVIKHNKNGMLFEQGAWKELADAMLHVRNNRNTYEQLANYADDLSAFSIATMTEQHVSLYRDLISK
jgi:glycosyltransferase involved in cell wall biosynthesis